MKRRCSARFARPSRDRPASANSRSPGKGLCTNKGRDGGVILTFRTWRYESGGMRRTPSASRSTDARPASRSVWSARHPRALTQPAAKKTGTCSCTHPKMALQAQNPGKSRKKIKKAVRLAPAVKQKEPAQPPWPIMTNYQQLSLIKPFRVKNKKPPPCPAPIHKRGGDGSRRAARLERFSSRQFEKEGGQGYIGINRI